MGFTPQFSIVRHVLCECSQPIVEYWSWELNYKDKFWTYKTWTIGPELLTLIQRMDLVCGHRDGPCVWTVRPHDE